MDTQSKKRTPKKDDEVYVLCGNSRGMTGKVLRRIDNKVVVQGINMRKKHVKPNQGQKGGVVTLEKPIHISNVKLLQES
ncbi:MAG: 50S ribosomal protein L24 [Chlamydiia bacterium]|nr:50S ribosomal protein L24 [Chlamydiia bacterium]